MSSAFEIGWNLLKVDPEDLVPDEEGDVMSPESSMPLYNVDKDIINEIAQMFLGTIDGFLESGQEDYILQHMPDVSDAEIEAGRNLAIQIFHGAMKG